MFSGPSDCMSNYVKSDLMRQEKKNNKIGSGVNWLINLNIYGMVISDMPTLKTVQKELFDIMKSVYKFLHRCRLP